MKQTVRSFWPNLQDQTIAKKKSATIPTSRWEFHCLLPDAPGTFQLTGTCHSSHPLCLWRAQAPQDVQEIQVRMQKSATENLLTPRTGSRSKHNSPQGHRVHSGAPGQKVGSLQEQTCCKLLQSMEGDLLNANQLINMEGG